MPLPKDILAYNAAQFPTDKRICDTLARTIDAYFTKFDTDAIAECKIWHRHPVWFLDSNPIVGYSKLKDCVRRAPRATLDVPRIAGIAVGA
jgi:hypothetical protein